MTSFGIWCYHHRIAISIVLKNEKKTTKISSFTQIFLPSLLKLRPYFACIILILFSKVSCKTYFLLTQKCSQKSFFANFLSKYSFCLLFGNIQHKGMCMLKAYIVGNGPFNVKDKLLSKFKILSHIKTLKICSVI